MQHSIKGHLSVYTERKGTAREKMWSGLQRRGHSCKSQATGTKKLQVLFLESLPLSELMRVPDGSHTCSVSHVYSGRALLYTGEQLANRQENFIQNRTPESLPAVLLAFETFLPWAIDLQRGKAFDVSAHLQWAFVCGSSLHCLVHEGPVRLHTTSPSPCCSEALTAS